MTDKECQAQIKRIRALFKKWQPKLGLTNYDLELIYSRDYHPENDGVAAATVSAWQYIHGTITWYLPKIREQSDRELEATMVHELCHILASSLWDLVTDETAKQGEYAIECIARAFLRCDKLKT